MKEYRYKSRVLSLWYEDGNGRETTISIKHTFCKDILNWMRKKKKVRSSKHFERSPLL